MGKAPSILVAIIFLCCWISIANAEYNTYQDPKQPVMKRVKDLLSKMTLQEKIGQMTQIERLVASADVLNKYYIGKMINQTSLQTSKVLNVLC